jgi:tetratricopeptide (TPR) repeat protein
MSSRSKRTPKHIAAQHPVRAQIPGKLQQALALHREGRLAQAQMLYEKVLKVLPAHFDALNSVGMIAAQTGNAERAVTFFERAIEADPLNVLAHVNKGLALHTLMRLDAALASYDAAIALRPRHAPAHFNRANVQLELGDLDAALAGYDATLSIDPGYVEAHCNRGVALHQLERFEAALASFDRAIALRPNYANAHFNRSLVWLAQGDFARGWDGYEWRLKLPRGPNVAASPRLARPRWTGKEPVAGKTILLEAEQGYGDTLQFCRYAELLARSGARVILEAQRPLLDLLSSLRGVSQVVAKGSALPPFDYHCSLMSLPLAFNTRVATIPSPAKYLESDPAKLAQWRSRLGERKRPRLGLAWSGSATNRNERNRSFALADLLPHLPPQFDYFRLQKDAREADERTLRSNPRIVDFSADLRDFSDTAALCDCMDIVISSCTSVVHLSAALGRATWVLLGHAADWRWLVDRDDSPWYASAKLYRRHRADAWDDVFRRVATDLAALPK